MKPKRVLTAFFFGACHDDARQQDHAGEGGLHPDDRLETQTWLTNTDDVLSPLVDAMSRPEVMVCQQNVS